MPLIELSDYTLAPVGSGLGINQFYFSLSEGDICAIEATHPDDAALFLKALATLVRPLKGRFHCFGEKKDLNNYRDLLTYKQCVGYIAPDSALVSNLTLRQNFLMRRFYFENNLSRQLDDEVFELCRVFNIHGKLDRRPSVLNHMEMQAAIVIREMIKKPKILLINRPEDFLRHSNIETMGKMFNDWIVNGLPLVILSYDRRMIRRFANRKILITNGSLATIDVRQQSYNETTDQGDDAFDPPRKE